MTILEMRKALRLYRLEENISYERIAEEIGLHRVNARTVRRFVEGKERVRHRETTLYAIQKYVERKGLRPTAA